MLPIGTFCPSSVSKLIFSNIMSPKSWTGTQFIWTLQSLSGRVNEVDGEDSSQSVGKR